LLKKLKFLMRMPKEVRLGYPYTTLFDINWLIKLPILIWELLEHPVSLFVFFNLFPSEMMDRMFF